MHQKLYRPVCVSGIILIILSLTLVSPSQGFAEEGYPEDYTPSTQAEGGRRKSLDRVFAVTAYMTDKLDAAGGEKSAECYRGCLVAPWNEALACAEANDSYNSSESCEKNAAQKMAACDPKCSDSGS